jgi:hypothetical protein
LGIVARLDVGQGVDAAVAESAAALEGEDVGVVADADDHGGGDDRVSEDAAHELKASLLVQTREACSQRDETRRRTGRRLG